MTRELHGATPVCKTSEQGSIPSRVSMYASCGYNMERVLYAWQHGRRSEFDADDLHQLVDYVLGLFWARHNSLIERGQELAKVRRELDKLSKI